MHRFGPSFWAAAAALLLMGAAVAVGGWLNARGTPVQASTPPLYALWRPHVGPGTLPAIVLAVAVVVWGFRVAAALPWRWLLAAAYAGAVAWTFSLAMVDGWALGVADRLTADAEYLWEVPGVADTGAMLRSFSSRILDFLPDSWNTHVSGHPPGVLLFFVTLDRVGLGGGAAAGLACILIGGLTAVAVPVTVRALGSSGSPRGGSFAGEAAGSFDGEAAARVAVPFLVLFPGAVWIGVSADGVFAGVTSAGIALLALALTRSSVLAGLGSGVLLGFACYLSYGMVLMAVLVLAVVILARRFSPLVWVVLGGLAVVAAFTVAGFWWLDGYHLVVQRYYQGIASDRPYAYWAWANLAAFLLSAGPLAAVVTARAAMARRPWLCAAALLPLAALVTVAAADLSGLSKAEVERIWLPFAVWFAAGAALLPLGLPVPAASRKFGPHLPAGREFGAHLLPGHGLDPHLPAGREFGARRWWLLAQAVTALTVNHLLQTVW